MDGNGSLKKSKTSRRFAPVTAMSELIIFSLFDSKKFDLLCSHCIADGCNCCGGKHAGRGHTLGVVIQEAHCDLTSITIRDTFDNIRGSQLII